MTDPYEVLGIKKGATEDEINTAYRKLVKQYHPDKYVGNPLADLAAEKIREINAAYDSVINDLKNSNSQNTNNQGSYSYSGTYNAGGQNGSYDANEIRRLINEGKLNEAQNLLNRAGIRDAEWHFLMGMVLKNKGWYDMAYQHLNRASQLDPTNAEYRQARDGRGFSGYEYRTMGNGMGGADCPGMCQGLICADCCCEMCGGNIIPCIGCR